MSGSGRVTELMSPELLISFSFIGSVYHFGLVGRHNLFEIEVENPTLANFRDYAELQKLCRISERMTITQQLFLDLLLFEI